MTYARALRWTAGAALATATLLITAPAHAAASASAPASASASASTFARDLPLASAYVFTPGSAVAPGSVAAASAASVAAAAPADADVADAADRAFEDLAGSSAGAGRERPGRPVGEPANPETVLAARPVPARPRTEQVPAVPATPSEAPVVGALGTEPNERAADLAAHILPLGTGFALMGLGLGFMGMRLRRGM
ncbi:hypothetical protein [Streptomyces sp. AP-93]|uniref:hypothetical protein n=1 Tax=Streptomyces sp. AP-93 TaxID=2929048 RepID=UPI001FAEE573|nr:hypothetical protein [Streptomyces sp. AP-93]MCJ0868724.1 hypothetical protein [Streptomyces sp. AP-93]